MEVEKKVSELYLERFRFAASFNGFFKKKLNNIKVDAEVSGFCK